MVGLLPARMARNGNKTVIADGVFAILSLHDFKHTDDFAFQDKAGCGGGVMQDQRV